MVLPVIRGNKNETVHINFHCIGDERKVNAAFEDWVTMDQLLLGWLDNSMSPDVASHVLGCKSSQELWESLKIFQEYNLDP